MRIVTQPLVPAKSGAKSTAVKSTGGKNTKKSTMAKKVGTGSSSKLSTSGSANDSEALKTSHFGSILAKGLADIEAAAHPYRYSGWQIGTIFLRYCTVFVRCCTIFLRYCTIFVMCCTIFLRCLKKS